VLVTQIHGTISSGAVNAICFAKFKSFSSLESTTGLVTEVKFIPSSEYYNLKIIPKIKSVKADEITCDNIFTTVQLSVTSGGIVGNLSAFTDFTNPTGYFSCEGYQIYSLTSSEFKDLTTRTNKFKNHINFVNQFVTTQFLANKNGELKHLDSLEININETQKDLWDNKAGNFKGLRFKFNEDQFRIDKVNGLTLYRNDIAAPKFHQHAMADITDWDIVSGELYNYFSPKVHKHVLNDITNWESVSGANLSKLYSEFYDHIKDMILHRWWRNWWTATTSLAVAVEQALHIIFSQILVEKQFYLNPRLQKKLILVVIIFLNQVGFRIQNLQGMTYILHG
jgi:hypothetical protein